VASSTGVGMS